MVVKQPYPLRLSDFDDVAQPRKNNDGLSSASTDIGQEMRVKRVCVRINPVLCSASRHRLMSWLANEQALQGTD